jgi:DNA-binding CsgD family transcriptional regulator
MHRSELGTESGGPQVAFEVLAEWVASLHGNGEFGQALGRLARLVGAEAAIAARFVESQDRHRQIAVAERLGGHAPLRARGISHGLPELASLRPAAISVLSDVRREAGFVEREWVSEGLKARGICDAAVLVLGSRGGCIDYVEFLFRHAIRRRDQALLAEMAPTLASAWGGRLPGTVERLIARSRFREDRQKAGRQDDILAPSNPAGLSRSEYRICALVREGLVAKAIAEELVLCESTVRSHLRSIYAKTGAAGHVDLLHRLTSPATPSGVPAALSA